jgi:hypothetical protein
MSHDDNEKEICVNCQLASVMTEWRDSGAPVTDVVDAIRDLASSIVYAALDEIFDDADAPVDAKAAH